MSDYHVIYGSGRITFSISRRQSLSCRIRIHVEPDRRVVVEAPPDAPMSQIKSAVLKRARWIRTQLHTFDEAHRHALTSQYASGETHRYLGKRYLLKVRSAAPHKQHVKLRGGYLEVCTTDQSPEQIRLAVNAWYRGRAAQVFARRLAALCPDLPWVDGVPAQQLRPMKKQWGSCSPKGRLSLNPALVKAPRPCIDYVLLHELCHLKHHNHSERYYALLTHHMPEWQHRKQRLDNLAEVILRE